MLDGLKYTRELAAMKLAAMTCPHCGHQTHFFGKSSFCNFCEQYIDVVAGAAQGDKAAQNAFASVVAPLSSQDLNSALKNAEQLLKGNTDPRQLYFLAQFYLDLAGINYRERNYNLHGFMEENAQHIRTSLDLTMRWKECYFKAIKIIDTELQANLQIDKELILIKFLSEIRLKKYVDAASTLRMLQTLDKKGALVEYALLLYSVEKNAKQAEASLTKALANQDANAFYYLAHYLAKNKKLVEAEAILKTLSAETEIFLAQDLLSKVQATIEASAI